MKTTHEWKSIGTQIYKCIHCRCVKRFEFQRGKSLPTTIYESNHEKLYIAPKCISRYTEKEKIKYFSKNEKATQLELFTVEKATYKENIFIDKPFQKGGIMNKDPTTKYVFAEFNTNVKLKKTVKMSKEFSRHNLKEFKDVIAEQDNQIPNKLIQEEKEPVQINCIMWLIKWLWKLITNRKKTNNHE